MIVSGLDYPNYCSVDSVFEPYGGPVRVRRLLYCNAPLLPWQAVL